MKLRKKPWAKRIYLDHASITPISIEVSKEMRQYSSARYGNPSSIHAEGAAASMALGSARRRVAEALHALPDEIVFTGSGTEANNLAITGLYQALKQKTNPKDLHALTSVIEHSSVREVMAQLSREGVAVEYVGVNEGGTVDADEIREKIRPNTFLVSIMQVNNEIGTIQPISDIAKAIRHARKKFSADGESLSSARWPYFHVDTSQSPEYLPMDMRSLGADMVTLDGQKIYGPRGIGMLWVKRAIELEPLIRGGGQERGLRSGTENLASICGFAAALERALDPRRQMKEAARVCALRDHFLASLEDVFGGMIVNGDRQALIPHILNISLPNIDTEFLLIQLDANGIACSTKSSCLRDEDESYVLRALGRSSDAASHSLRFSLGRQTTKRDIDSVLAVICQKTGASRTV